MAKIVGSQNKTKNHAKWHYNKLICGAYDEEFTFSSCTCIKNYILSNNLISNDIMKITIISCVLDASNISVS